MTKFGKEHPHKGKGYMLWTYEEWAKVAKGKHIWCLFHEHDVEARERHMKGMAKREEGLSITNSS